MAEKPRWVQLEFDFNDPPTPVTDDVITGYPDHYVVNGDPAFCGCPEHRRTAAVQKSNSAHAGG